MTASKAKKSHNLLNDYHLLSFDSLDSTNEEARRLAKAGGSHGAVIWAKTQTAGRGRMGRSWVSSEGNLFVSVLLKPERPMSEFSQLSLVAALAVLDSLVDMVPNPEELKTKWPNDILLQGKKLAGILLESFKAGEDGDSWVVVGVGVNVESAPGEVSFPATCLTGEGVELVSAKIILSRFIHHFIECYNEWHEGEFAQIRKRWLASAWSLGKPVEIRLPDGTVNGVFEGLDASGSLLLALGGGRKQHILAGDMFPGKD